MPELDSQKKDGGQCLVEHFALYLSEQSFAGSTRRTMLSLIKSFVQYNADSFLKTSDAKTILPELANRYCRDYLSVLNREASSLNGLITALRHLFRSLGFEREFFFEVRKSETQTVPMSLAEQQALRFVMAKRATKRDRLIFILQLDYGLALRELCSLKIADIHLVDGATALLVHNRSTECRILVVDEKAARLICDLVRERKVEDYLLISKWGRPLSQQTVDAILKSYAKMIKARCSNRLLKATFLANQQKIMAMDKTSTQMY